MKRIILLTLITSFYASAMYAQSVSDGNSSKKYLGRWIVDSIVLKSTVDSVYSEKMYSVNGEIPDAPYILCPQEVAVTGDSVVLEYGTYKMQGKYSINGDILRIEFATHVAEYRYGINKAGKMRFTFSMRHPITGKNGAYETEVQYIVRKKQ